MQSATLAADSTRTSLFDQLPLAPFLKETIRSIGYTEPTPIQAEAIPVIIEGRDLVGLAQTGTGKTAAFVLPILQRLSGRKEKGAKALILAPTRELAEQIHEVVQQLAPRTGIKSITIYGGVSHSRQISDLRGRPQIIVACPGRLLDHMGGRTVDLSGIEVLVLDEADRMCDMGFLPDIKKIIKQLPTERQTLLFSATMPEEIQELTRGIQNDPAIIRVKMESPVASVTHSMFQIASKAKPALLAHWLGDNREALVVVFTKMKHTARRLAEQLAKQGQHVTSLHGNLSQGKRQKALSGFKDGQYRVLIATDIAARGIDVKGITHVVNYDMPENLDAYIHRTGRAGRASATGDAVSFVTKADTGLLRSIERWLKAPVARLETPVIEGADLTDEASGESRGRGQRQSSQRHSGQRRERPRRNFQGGDRRERSGDRRERSGDRPERRRDERRAEEPRAFDRPRAERPEREDRPFNRRTSGQERPRERRREGTRNRGEGQREASFGQDSSRPHRQNFRRNDRPSYNSDRPRRGQPRDPFQALEGPDLSQVEALQVLDRSSNNNRRNNRGRGGQRGRGFGSRSDRFQGSRGDRHQGRPSRTSDRE